MAGSLPVQGNPEVPALFPHEALGISLRPPSTYMTYRNVASSATLPAG